MKIRLRLALMSVALAVTARLVAQDDRSRQLYNQAESEYQLGQLSQAQQLLEKHVESLTSGLQVDGYRLLALCYLGMDNEADAERCAAQLLRLDPYYSPSAQDPARFIDMIGRLKGGFSPTITTASNQSESLDEAPVPVTLITEEMIAQSGARNLKELLVTFVPGMNHVESNEEMNIAMRGIYSSGQEKILIMLNGHRLNSYCTNVARPDFTVSLDKVKQIEVLRGPASSLYGGVALTAVINVITKSGSELDGLQLKGAAGNYGQWTGEAVFGKHFIGFDVVGWASLYHSAGEKYYIPQDEVKGTAKVAGDVIIGGYNHRPTYDLGINLNYKRLNVMHNTSFSKTVAPYSLSYFFSPYDYHHYAKLDGSLPGFANTAHHSELSYSLDLGPVGLKATVNLDAETQQRYQVGADLLPESFVYDIYIPGWDQSMRIYEGVFQNLRWNEENIGARIQANYAYRLPGGHSGSLVAGVQYDYFRLTDAQNVEGDQFNRILVSYDDEKSLWAGTENSYNSFLQFKHKWRDFILNTGIRYDHKERFYNLEGLIKEWSPRLALIYVRPKWNLKLSYSKAFVDAPYFYRYNTLDTYQGGALLQSEYLHSFQVSFSSHDLLAKGLQTEINAFYNRATNLVHPEGMYYWNSGSMKNVGIELIAAYKWNRFTARLNTTWQHLVDADDYKATDSQIYNIPKLSCNLVASYNVVAGLNVYTNINYTSSQITTFEMPDEWGLPIYNEISIPSKVIVNMGATCQIKKLRLGFRTYNTLNHHYEQGGTSIGPIRQQGLWLLGEIAYKL